MSLPATPCHSPSTFSNCASDERGYWRIRCRQDTAENWLKNDPRLASGELGYVIGATDGPNLKIGDGWLRWSQLPWLVDGQGTGGSCGSHIVSDVEPPPGEAEGDLWINPTEIVGDLTIIDVLAAIRGQVIAPKAIDIDGPNTLFITTDIDGTAKLSLRKDGTPLREITEENIATEEWVRAQLGATTPTSSFSNANPPVYAGQPVVEQDNGLPIGLSPDGMEIHQPYMIGAVPVLVGGKRFLMPLLEAPAPAPGGDPTPLFTYLDQPVTQQLDGTIIGLSADGTEITQPYMVGGVYVLVGGKKYLLPLIEE
jgi:hypothetical protein